MCGKTRIPDNSEKIIKDRIEWAEARAKMKPAIFNNISSYKQYFYMNNTDVIKVETHYFNKDYTHIGEFGKQVYKKGTYLHIGLDILESMVAIGLEIDKVREW